MILVVAEQREGKLNRATWEAIAAAQQAGDQIRIALLGANVDALAGELAAAEAEAVVSVDAAALGEADLAIVAPENWPSLRFEFHPSARILRLAAACGERQRENEDGKGDDVLSHRAVHGT